MKAQRRTIVPVNESERAWQSDRDWQVQRAINAGLGARPSAWWTYESGRPDVAKGAGAGDVYAQLRVDTEDPWPWRHPHPDFARAIERLRFLIAGGELRPSEIAAIRAGRGSRYDWRREVLDEALSLAEDL